ncbi:M13 family metallopeptidase [Labilibacter sediminis]|nr:M13 family metallopeptidase [Labilibacter sediminis]
MKHLAPQKLILGLFVLLVGCTQSLDKKESQKPNFSKENLNTTVNAGDDFFRYVNGKWLDNNPIPDDKSRFGWFDLLLEDNRKKLKALFKDATEGSNEPGSVAQKIGDFYNAGMDTLSIEEEGLKKLEPVFKQIDAIESADDIPYTIGFLHSYQLNPLFYFYVTADKKNSSMNIAGIYQGGLGLPDRDYYLDTDDASLEIKNAYSTYLNTIFTLMGEDSISAKNISQQLLDFETKLANAYYTRIQNRDPHLTYNKIKCSNLPSAYKGFNWDKYFEGLSIQIPDEININQTSYLTEVGNLVQSESPDIWKKYLKALTVRSLSSYLAADYVNAKFELYGKAIQGKSAMEPRWKRVQGTTSNALGEAVGQLFVEKYFPAEAKERMEVLVENLRVGFAQRIDRLEWMSDETKLAAKDKLKAIGVKVGYPNKWRDYRSLQVGPDSYVGNVLASNRFDFKYEMSKIEKPVDKEEWHMFPQTVNAYYNPTGNEIVFPAAILQPPFFYLNGDDAVNYGAIGVVIGHEMTHGFDDQGSQYDKEGNLANWWTSEDSTNFANRTQVLVEQFNQFQIKDTIYANGELTLGENIADLGGLNIAFAAYMEAIKDKGEIANIDGLSKEERFLISYANLWAENIREKEKLRMTKVDVHSLAEFRVNGPLPNMDLYYTTFAVTPESKMYIAPENRADIW